MRPWFPIAAALACTVYGCSDTDSADATDAGGDVSDAAETAGTSVSSPACP